MSILVFDTETTGFAKGGVQPRIIQIAWAVYSLSGELLSSRSSLVMPDGWEVPMEKFWIENGHSTIRCMESGVEINLLLDHLLNDISHYDISHIVAHNLAFDIPVLAAEMNRLRLVSDKKLKKICTMKSSESLFGKWPKLIQLYTYLFNKGFEGEHDAMSDVNACAECFFELVKRNIIRLEE